MGLLWSQGVCAEQSYSKNPTNREQKDAATLSGCQWIFTIYEKTFLETGIYYLFFFSFCCVVVD